MQNNINPTAIAHSQMIISKFTHELRNPLSLIFSEFQLLMTNHPETSDWGEMVDILEQLHYLNELLNEFSNYNNADKLCLKSACIHDILLHIVNSFRPTLDYLEIQFIAEISETLPPIELDAIKFRQAILNLLRNAQESISHDHGKIYLRAHCISPDKIEITICDNGCGILPEYLDTLGTPFVTHKPSGTGLGFAVTKQIIEAHGGCLSLKSTPDIGTNISISLPILHSVTP